jgi:hypothetical protein
MSFIREPNAEPIPGYRLIEPLGSGGFGEAWKCEAPGGIFKAIKFVFGNLESDDTERARAEQELKALDRIKEVRHPFVLQLDRIEIVKGELVIVMELADKSLHDSYEESRSAGLVGIPRDALLRYIRDAAEALDHMNEKHGLQHLDIKPRNLFLISDRVKVADFGLVKNLERSGGSGIMGAGGVTPLYAPPETFTGEISAHSDQYSLAIVYQELLTGHRPHNGKNARQLANQHLNEPPDLRALPEAERAVVGRALEKDPNHRFPNCLAFVRALYACRPPSLPGLDDAGKRHKTVVDTLENIQLEGMPGEVAPDNVHIVKIGSEGEAVSSLGMTIARPDCGPLRPTLIVGVGGFGRRALLELRCRLLDRFGDLEKVPAFRFLYIDTDPDAVKVSQRGAAEVAMRAYEVYHLPLQPVSHYRRRQLDQVVEWLPREKLYAIPRSLKTQGSRALGRLAFTDNYMRLFARLKRELQEACNPDRIVHTVNQTGLALRDDVPRVYVVCGGTGGSSGCLSDLGFTMRRLLKELGHANAPVTAFLACGAPEDPATPKPELANLYATLTEVNHYADPAITFSAQYGADGPRLVDQGKPFDQVYLLAQHHRSPEARRDTLSHLSSYLFHDMTTPLGLRLDHNRTRRGPTPFRSLGTFGVWFPRGLLLRLAARDACLRLADEWQAAGSGLGPSEQAMLKASIQRALADPDLSPETLANTLAERASEHMDGHPRDALTRVLLAVEEQSLQPVAQDDPGNWARQALTRVRDWLGTGVALPGVNAVQQKRSVLTRALEAAASALAREWDMRLGQTISTLMEQGGRRIALAEAAAQRLMHYCDEAIQAHKQRVRQEGEKTAEGKETLEQSLQSCLTGGGWSFFGSRSRRSLRIFVDHLAIYARQCLAEDTITAVLQFLAALRGKMGDRLRDLGFCRQRLRHLQETLRQEGPDDEVDEPPSAETMTFSRTPPVPGSWQGGGGASNTPVLLSTESYWQSIRESATNRVVLPDGETDLEQAARQFLALLTPEHWMQLDQSIGDQVLTPRGGLLRLCLDSGDLVRHFTSPLLNHAIGVLTSHLPVTDVAEVEFSAADGVDERIKEYFASATPALPGAGSALPPVAAGAGSGQWHSVGPAAGTATEYRPNLGNTRQKCFGQRCTFLLVPASDAGRSFAEIAKDVVPEVSLVKVPGQADLMFCTELAGLKLDDLEQILRNSRNAFNEAALTPQSSPHSRFDMTDWKPLDP